MILGRGLPSINSTSFVKGFIYIETINYLPNVDTMLQTDHILRSGVHYLVRYCIQEPTFKISDIFKIWGNPIPNSIWATSLICCAVIVIYKLKFQGRNSYFKEILLMLRMVFQQSTH